MEFPGLKKLFIKILIKTFKVVKPNIAFKK